jgi:hypothetical protein
MDDMVDGELVLVWLPNDVDDYGPYLGKVIRARKQWVEIDHFWSDGDSFIADDTNILKWERPKNT